MDEASLAVPTARWAQRHPWIVLALWALACALLGVRAMGAQARVSGGLESLLPVEQRTSLVREHLLLRHDGTLTTDELLSAADRVHEALDDAWIPLAAPAAERDGWLDAHALYLLPPATHEALQQRLSDENIRASVDALHATMSSPFFGLTTAESRRDPLRLRALTADVDAAASWDAPDIARQAAPTPAGDLLAYDGRSLLMGAHRTQPNQDLVAIAAASVPDTVDITEVGTRAKREAVRLAVLQGLPNALWIAFAGVTLVLAAVLRNVRRTLAALGCVGSAAILCASIVPLDPLSVPLAILAVGFAGAAVIPHPRLTALGWAVPTVLGSALVPLMLLDFELLQTWVWTWAAIVAAMVTLVRLVLPAMLAVLRVPELEARRRSVLRPTPVVALVLSLGLTSAGAWALAGLDVRGSDRLDLIPADRTTTLVRETYFDPALVVTAGTTGDDEARALTLAADDARLLSTLIPTEARTIDTPASLVLPADELERRKAGLARLELEERLTKLREQLAARGFRSAAFGEFLRSASDSDRVPTPEAALDGPLARWIHGYFKTQDGRATLEARVHLGPDPDVVPPALQTADGRTLVVRGPAIGGRLQAKTLQSAFGIALGAQLWIGAFVVWIAVRRLTTAIAASLAAVATHGGLLAILHATNAELSVAVLPLFLVLGAAAIAGAAVAWRSATTGATMFVSGALASGAVRAAAGLALAASPLPLWSQLGAAASAGSLLAAGVGLFVGPGLALLLARKTEVSQ